MPISAPRYPAYMLFREQGEIIFASPKAVEHAGWMTGAAPSALWTLDEVVGALLPGKAERSQAQASLDRMLGLVRRRGRLRVRLSFPVPDLRPGRWDVELALKADAAEETFLASFQPVREGLAPEPSARPCPPCETLRRAADQARQLLDRALAEAELPDPDSDPLPEELERLVALVEHTRGLLASLSV